MTGRYEQVADKITRLSGVDFQRMMDAYARLHFPGFAGITAEGSHKTKRKTKTGTPDSLYWLNNGAIIMGEHSTRADGIVPKFQEDLDKCKKRADELNLGKNDFEVALCYNDRLSSNEEVALRNYAEEIGVNLSILALDTLAIDISLIYPEIAEQYLGISYDTGQVMTADNFIRFHHNHAGEWVTPIDNPLIGREAENQEVENCLMDNKVVVLGGSPGVGKTKFALEFLRRKYADESVPVFVVRDNGQSVWTDVQRLKNRGRKFILMIDDADRQLPLVKQVVTLIKRGRKQENIQLLLTVRSIAKRDLEDVLQIIGWKEVRLAGPSEDSIVRMVSGEPYHITDKQVIRRIVKVSHNNARFAMMVSRLAKDDPSVLDSGRIGDIYRAYYQRYISGVEELNDPVYVRVLGLLAMFRIVRMDENHQDTFASLLSLLGMSKTTFLGCIAKLEKKELVEREFKIVKMDDQHLRAYYFYRAFMEDKVLDFKDILFQFYHPNDSRFRNIVNNTAENFGREEVLETLGVALTTFCESLSEDRLLPFYENFGALWPERTLAFIGGTVIQLIKPENPIFEPLLKDKTQRSYSEDRLLRLIGSHFQYDDNQFRQGLELAFEYVRRNPDTVSSLISQLDTISHFEFYNETKNAARQQLFYRWLLQKINGGDSLSKRVFLELIDVYLRGSAGVRSFLFEYNNHAALIATGENPNFKPLRASLWSTLIDFYDDFPHEVSRIIKLTRHRRGQPNRAVLDLDRRSLRKLFSQKFSPERIEEAMIVQEIAHWLIALKAMDDEFLSVHQEYTTPAISLFDDLSWREREYGRRVRGKDARKYESVKREELKQKYSFTSLKAFSQFLDLLEVFYLLPESEPNRIGSSVDLVLANMSADNPKLGTACVKLFIEHIDLRPGNVLVNTVKEAVSLSKERAVSFMTMLQRLDQKKAAYWRGYAFYWIKESYLTEPLRISFSDFVNSFKPHEELRLATLRKLSRTPEELNDILQSWYTAVAPKYVQPRFSNLEELTDTELAAHFSIVKQLYLVFGRDDIFDRKQKLLLRILKRDPTFFFDFIDKVVSQPSVGRPTPRDEEFGFIWAFPESSDMMADCLDCVLRDRFVSVATYSTSWLDSLFDPFFTRITTGQERAEAFALKYLADNYEDVRKTRSMIDCIGKNLRSIAKEALYVYLDATQDPKKFAGIDWGNLFKKYENGEIDFQADLNLWEKLQLLLNDYPRSTDLFAIRQVVQNRLKWAKVDEERRKRDIFIGNEW